MSKPDCVPARPIPPGILVCDVDLPRKQERPSPTPVVPRQTVLPDRRKPWLWVVSAGSLTWALVVMTIAIRAGGKEIVPSRDPEPPAQLTAAPPLALIPAPKPADSSPDDWRFDEAAVPVPPEPLPLYPEPPLGEAEKAPPVEIAPAEQPKPAPPAQPVVVAEPKRPKKLIDLKVYANCANIGTDVLFVKDPPEAFRRAKAENKLVYMMHLSGNLEDKDFT